MVFVTERIPPLKARRLGVDTHQELTIYLRADSAVCKSEGFTALSRVLVRSENKYIIATLNIITGDITGDMILPGEIGFSESAWKRLELNDGDSIWTSHPAPVASISHIRAKVYGHTLKREQFNDIVNDIVAGRYADVHLAAFITACGNDNMNNREITYLTEAMVNSGSKISWDLPLVVDKHCVGGLPGNRTTPIIVSILAASGLTVPKTSSRAITSPAGTADTMETLTNVSLSLDEMKKVVCEQGGCLAWGGSVRLSPADDLLIKVERVLDIDSEGQLIASVLSKKIAAGATHVLIDMPVGPTAKVRSQAAADKLADSFRKVAKSLGLTIDIMFTDGRQPVGYGIGPALEARDITAVLQNSENAPIDLKERAIAVAGAMLEMVTDITKGEGCKRARQLIDSGKAWEKFKQICEAQGGLREPPIAPYRFELIAHQHGWLHSVDNRRLSKVAKLAGAPADLAAGVEIHVKLGDEIHPNTPLLTIHAESAGELNYAVEYLEAHSETVQICADKEQLNESVTD
ncbi:thymidine phosphorylase family protein [Pontibacterium granulatum]|uniref:thymidine phosphorylase family protein n=1 Tax=Pontibacterium granulatum TaxID=2036029 RepID=UPI00249CA1ED|nr:thymidine phosphorylase family protein [Pontibacterium granulatum]MDI3323317.1 thymidine phosphorylase family protein [Pontibacterium granulatum]